MQTKAVITFEGDDLFRVQTESSDKLTFIDKAMDPKDSKGPNPLEMFLSAVGGCVGVFAKRYLKRHNIVFGELTIEVSADLAKDAPLRLVNIQAKVKTDADLGDKREVFMKFIRNCPVHNTLINTKDMTISLV